MVHLFVLQHGLWGHPSHLLRLQKHLQSVLAREEQDQIEWLNCASNAGQPTYDGIDKCGRYAGVRLVKPIIMR
jgi:hypothetical protein